MTDTHVRMRRFEPLHPWANRILWVDLSARTARVEPSAAYLPDYLGSRGLAARLCRGHYPTPVPPFDPANPLMVMTGALTGSRAPYAGRTNVCAFSPPAWPYPWFTRSSIGGHFGGELKRAGYDGLVVTGAADTPVRIGIRDDEVSILPAGEFWGLDIFDALEALDAAEGRGAYHLTIGPAGERLSRIATIQTGSSSAAGQGGFGAVMGSKKLKAISVSGSGRVPLANPERITGLARAIAKEAKMPSRFWGRIMAFAEEVKINGTGRVRRVACTEGCLSPCTHEFSDIPGVTQPRKWSGLWACIGGAFFPMPEEAHEGGASERTRESARQAAFELSVLSNRHGLNQFDLTQGMVPWLRGCQEAGLISELNGEAMDWGSPHFWAQLLHATAYREGMGDVLAEGAWRAAHQLHLGEEIIAPHYPGWGQAAHWTGRFERLMWFPYWVAPALQWASDTRDPFDSGHCSLWLTGPLVFADDASRPALVQAVRAIAERVYGTLDAFDAYSGYRGKAVVGHYHTLRPIIKDCVPTDDLAQFPLTWSNSTPDHYCRLQVEGLGEIEGPSAEYHLFAAGTGTEWSESDFDRAAQRVCTLERALQVRHWGRNRATDEMVLPHFEMLETCPSPFLGERYGLDREQFAPVLTEFYRLHGWDANGRPTKASMEALGMGEMHEPMVEGADSATLREVAAGHRSFASSCPTQCRPRVSPSRS